MNVQVPSGTLRLEGILAVPSAPKGAVVFAHGSGSGRFSSRNQYVAGVLQEAGLATLLIDLLAEGEEADRRNVFDIPLLADRLQSAADWLAEEPQPKQLRLGYFG